MKKIIFIIILLTAFIYSRNNSVVIYGSTNAGAIGVTDGSLDVMLADQTTEPVGSYFIRSISNFSLLSNTVASGITNLIYKLFVDTPAGKIAVGEEFILLDVASNKSFQATVLSITNNELTLDRPIDHAFITNTTLGRTVSSDMAVDGSVTPVIFSIRSGAIPLDITRLIITMTDDVSMDDGKFGGLASLTRGLVFRIVDSYNKTFYNFKNNGQIGNFCYDTDYKLGTAGPTGTEGFKARITFGGLTKHGVVIRIADLDVIQFIVQDDLSALSSFNIVAQGHLTTQ
jgi:hypothetical protein